MTGEDEDAHGGRNLFMFGRGHGRKGVVVSVLVFLVGHASPICSVATVISRNCYYYYYIIETNEVQK